MELRRLKAAARANPAPATLGALAERFISMGRLDDAYRTARHGISLFPTSDRLAKVCTFAKKQRLQNELTRLRKELASRPAPIVYSQLAEIYGDLGKHDQALEICEQCIEKFPLNENPYLIIGGLRLRRFLSDLIAHDGLEAERHLKRVLKLNPANVKAHMLLGHLAYVVGGLSDAVERLKEVMAISPGSSEIEEFLEELQSRLSSEEHEELSLSDRIRDVEQLRTFANAPESFPGDRFGGTSGGGSAELDFEQLRQSLSEFGARPGVTNALIMKRCGEPVACHAEPETLSTEAFTELVTDILGISEDAARRMDVGTFQWGSVEGSFGGVAVTSARDLSVAMMYDPKVKSDRAQSMLEDFTARNLTRPGEVSRA
jgi:tetratricopeptide (TPR) repeat protein